MSTMKEIYFLQLLLVIIRLTKGEIKHRAGVEEIASDCIPRATRIAKYKKASILQCAHACLANQECHYYAIKQGNKKSIRCNLYKDGDLKIDYQEENGWKLFKKMELKKEDSRRNQNERKPRGDVFQFMVPSTINYVNFSMNSIPTLSAFTICLQFNSHKQNTVLFGYWARAGSCDRVVITTNDLRVNGDDVSLHPATYGQRYWCVTWKKQSSKLTLYEGGEKVQHWNNINKHKDIDGGGHLILGQEYKNRCEKDEIDGARAFVGVITNVEMWNKELKQSEIANRKSRPNANLINWDTLKRDAKINGDVRLL